jgi:hypothetical protein
MPQAMARCSVEQPLLRGELHRFGYSRLSFYRVDRWLNNIQNPSLFFFAPTRSPRF